MYNELTKLNPLRKELQDPIFKESLAYSPMSEKIHEYYVTSLKKPPRNIEGQHAEKIVQFRHEFHCYCARPFM